MAPFIPALTVFCLGIVVGAVAWHFLHARVKQAYAVALNDVEWLKAEIERLKASVPAATASVAASVAVPPPHA